MCSVSLEELKPESRLNISGGRAFWHTTCCVIGHNTSLSGVVEAGGAVRFFKKNSFLLVDLVESRGMFSHISVAMWDKSHADANR